MYSVSDKYKLDMKEPVARFSIRGTIGSKAFTEDNIAGGSFSISNQCVDNDEILLGSVYIGELQATFQNVSINRYEWVGKVITVYHTRYFADDEEEPYSEEIPLGVFTIAEATISNDGVSVIAYDNMAKLDKTAQFNVTSGSAYGILSNICTQCGVTFAMTQEEVEALPNGTEIFGLWADNDIQTFRDMMSWMAQALASIVLVNRQGGIYLKTYDMDVVDEIGAENRFLNAQFSDYESRYSGISVVDIEKNTTNYYGTEQDIYLTYNLGANPFLQFGVASTKERMARAILDSLAATAYVPFNVQMLGDPAYDLGDVITLSGGLGDGTKMFVIQRYSYKPHGAYEAEGVGKNPDLANAKSKVDKEIAGLLNNTNQNQIQYYFYTNSDIIRVKNTKTKTLLDIRFASLKATIVMFHAEVLLEADTTNTVIGKVNYYINNVKVQTREPIETWIDGRHILHLLYHINIDDAVLTRFVVTLTAQGGTIEVPVNGVEAVIYGQGLAATESWDGLIDIEEQIPEVDFNSLDIDRNIGESFATYIDSSFKRATATDSIGDISLGGIALEGFNDSLLIELENA